MAGKVIVFEGIDYCGKGTQLNKLREFSEKNKLQWYFTFEPGGTPAGNLLREAILKSGVPMHSVTQQLIMFASRNELVHTELNLVLESGKPAFLDRYWFSTIVYQCLAPKFSDREQENNLRTAKALTSITACPHPSLVFIFDIPIAVYEQRLRVKGNKKTIERFEKNGPEFMNRAREGYLSLPDRYKHIDFRIIDGTLSEEVILTKYILPELQRLNLY